MINEPGEAEGNRERERGRERKVSVIERDRERALRLPEICAVSQKAGRGVAVGRRATR